MKRLLQASKFIGLGLIIGLSVEGSVRWQLNKVAMPGVMVGVREVGGLTKEEIKKDLVNYQEKCGLIDLKQGNKLVEENLILETDQLAQKAIKVGKEGIVSWNFLKGLSGNSRWQIPIRLTNKNWGKIKERSNLEFNQIGKKVKIRKIGDRWQITNGDDGKIVNDQELRRRIETALNKNDNCPLEIEVPMVKIRKKLNKEEWQLLSQHLESLKGKELKLKFGSGEQIVLPETEIANLLETNPGKKVGWVSLAKLKIYLRGIKTKIDRSAENARFKLVGGKVKEFAPAKEGRELLVDESATIIKKQIDSWLEKPKGREIEINLKIKTTKPKINIKDTNNLGIKELIGRGESYYWHSIPSRAYNVELAAKKINGVLVAPGQEFSFNQAVGDISRLTGFKSAYIIKEGKTILGDGGGVCQVSTTVFRAALNAGLPITERWAHAYRVGYYEQKSKPGFDATVYAPSRDLKFKNDTGSYILVHTWWEHDKRHLVVDLYGKKDGRKAEIKNWQMWDVVPPPPPIYQDDPTLPKGVTKQVDWAAWGTKVKFDYLVKKNNQIIFSKTFFSNYKPWQDVFLVGTKE